MAKRPYKWNPDENSFEVSIKRQPPDSSGQNAANVQPSIPQSSGIPPQLEAQTQAEIRQSLPSGIESQRDMPPEVRSHIQQYIQSQQDNYKRSLIEKAKEYGVDPIDLQSQTVAADVTYLNPQLESQFGINEDFVYDDDLREAYSLAKSWEGFGKYLDFTNQLPPDDYLIKTGLGYDGNDIYDNPLFDIDAGGLTFADLKDGSMHYMVHQPTISKLDPATEAEINQRLAVSIAQAQNETELRQAVQSQPKANQPQTLPSTPVVQVQQSLASQSSAQAQAKNIAEAAQEIPSLTQAAFQSQVAKQVGNTSSTYEAQVQAELRQQATANAAQPNEKNIYADPMLWRLVRPDNGERARYESRIYNPSDLDVTRNPAPYTLSQGQLFAMDGDRPYEAKGVAKFDYPVQDYEQEQAVNYPRKLGEERFSAYMDEAVNRAQAATQQELNNFQANRVKARASEQLRIGAPIVPFDPSIDALKVEANPLRQFTTGVYKGWQNQNLVGDYNPSPIRGGGQGENASYSRSYIADKLTGNNAPYLYQDRPLVEQAGVELGRIAGDVMGAGTRKFLWNVHPEDMLSTYGKDRLKAWTNLDPGTRRAATWGAAGALGILGGNYNPLNFGEGGRPAGFQAITPNEDDPRKSDSAAMDYLVYRGLMGRSGRLLPWEQFTEERPDVSYDQYAAYQQYLRDPGFLGLAKGTIDGIDGPEARVMGYRITPEGVLGAGAVMAGAMYLGRKR